MIPIVLPAFSTKEMKRFIQAHPLISGFIRSGSDLVMDAKARVAVLTIDLTFEELNEMLRKFSPNDR